MVKENNILHKGKGAIQVDYILAVSIFLIFFALTIQYTTDYFSTVRETTAIADLRSEGVGLLGIADRSFDPPTWPQIVNGSNDLLLLMHLNNDTLDYSGKDNNGTAINGTNCAPSVQGRFFSGCMFDGINDLIEISAAGIFNFSTNDFTVATWVKYNNTLGEQIIIEKWNLTGGPGWTLTKLTNNTYRFGGCSGGSGGEKLCVDGVPSAVANNTWYHIAVTRTSNNFSMYWNGDPLTSSNFSDSLNTTQPVRIGRRDAESQGLFMNGTIDEVAILNRSLAATEIRELYQQSLIRIGLRTDAFRFIVIVNNTKPNLVNTSENATALTLVNELVRFNLSTFGFSGIDYNSVVIYNETNYQVPFQINGSNITFSVNVTVNASRQFTVYFDDDSLFGEKSQNVVTEVDNLTETSLPVERISILQYEKMLQLNQSNYTNVRNTGDVESNFRIKLIDYDTNATFIDYGGTTPRKGNIIALQRYAVFQNSTAGIRNGRLTIQTW